MSDRRPTIRRPAVDIRFELEQCLQDHWPQTEDYEFYKTYGDAVNPALRIAGVGVGLPLSENDALLVQRHRRLAHSSADNEVSKNTWEVDASLVSFGNPKWDAFAHRVAIEACALVCVDSAASKPQLWFSKLLLSGDGSNFMSRADPDRSFATIIIVLPSQFTGGSMSLSHGALSTSYDFNSYETTAVAWYTPTVVHELKPITSGYRLAVVYNLLHTATCPRPEFSKLTENTSRLRRLLLSWTKDVGRNRNTPSKIVYMLDDTYSLVNLRTSPSADALKFAVLEVLTRELNLHLALADLTSCCNDDHCGSLSGESDCDSFHESENEYHWDTFRSSRNRQYSSPWFVHHSCRHEMSSGHLVDLQGVLVSKHISCNDPGESIPDDIQEAMWRDDDTDFSTSRSRTVLVIWSQYNDVEVRYANDVKRACRKLSLSVGKGPVVPSADDLTLAEFVLTLTFQEPLLVARTVCRAANAWNLLALWERAMKVCAKPKGIVIFKAVADSGPIFNAIQHFGFSSIKPTLEILLECETCNIGRFSFLQAVETWHNVAVSAGDAASNAQLNDVLPWVSHARESSVQSLCELRHGDSSLFVKLSLIHGNIGFLRDSILPRIEDAVLLRDFATRVYDDPNLAKITSKTIQTEIASLIMSKALSLTSFTMKSGSAKIGLELVKRYLEPCMGRFHNLLPVIFQKVASVTSLTSSEAHQQIYDVMIPLLEDVAQYVQSHPGAADSLPSMVKYLNFTLGVFVKRVKAPLKYTTSRKSIWALVTAMTLPGGLETLVALSQSLVDALSPMHCHLFIKSMSNHADYLLFPTDHTGPNASSLMSALLTKYSETAVLSKSEEVIDSLQFCLVRRALVPTCADNIIKRILEPRCLLLPEYVDNILAPSILDLRELARTHNLVDHFMPTLRTIVLTWFEKVFQAQRKPQIDESAPLCVALSRFCTCQLCTPIRSFFQDQSKLELRVLAPVIGTSRRHVEEQVKRAGREMLSLTKNLEGLRITKSENVYWTMRWHAVQARGLAILHAASDTRAGLEHMLGTQFSTISALVGYDSSSGSMDGETRPAKRRRVTHDQDPTVIYTIGKSTLYGSTSMTLDFTKA